MHNFNFSREIVCMKANKPPFGLSSLIDVAHNGPQSAISMPTRTYHIWHRRFVALQIIKFLGRTFAKLLAFFLFIAIQILVFLK
jgi:hypothetical protein